MKRKEAKRKMGINEKVLLAAVIVLASFAFLEIAISNMNNFLKAPLLLITLFASGKLMAKLGRLEDYYGIIILRGEEGFGLMHKLAKHPKLMRALADFGMSIGFGLVYSFFVFRNHPKKFLGHAIIVCSFFVALLYSNAATQSGWEMAAIGVLGGLLSFGVASLAIQALNIVTVPGATAGASLVVPGVTIPFWEGLIAIIVAATVHEIAHGVLAMVEKLEVKNSGVILFGVLPVGAFVEPNEKKLSEIDIHKKRRILIAGTTANFLTFLLFSALVIPLVPLGLGMADGVQVAALSKDSASKGILGENEIITAVNGIAISNYPQFAELMKGKKEGDVVKLTTDKGEKAVTLGANGKLGIVPDNHFPESNLAIGIFLFIMGTFSWIIIINLALAVINLVPIFLTDGYRLVYEEARGVFPSKGDAKAKQIAIAAGAICVLLLLINFLPNFR